MNYEKQLEEKKKEFEEKFVWRCNDSLCDDYGEIQWNTDNPYDVWLWFEQILKQALEEVEKDFIKMIDKMLTPLREKQANYKKGGVLLERVNAEIKALTELKSQLTGKSE